ncbi:hypothetical protein AB0N07_21735 [Streptomyces sp. NPDC051172]
MSLPGLQHRQHVRGQDLVADGLRLVDIADDDLCALDDLSV